jgi:hypothetical protein
MKNIYIFPQTKIVGMICQATILDGSNNNYIDSKENNFYDDSDSRSNGEQIINRLFDDDSKDDIIHSEK